RRSCSQPSCEWPSSIIERQLPERRDVPPDRLHRSPHLLPRLQPFAEVLQVEAEFVARILEPETHLEALARPADVVALEELGEFGDMATLARAGIALGGPGFF